MKLGRGVVHGELERMVTAEHEARASQSLESERAPRGDRVSESAVTVHTGLEVGKRGAKISGWVSTTSSMGTGDSIAKAAAARRLTLSP